jgi:hypothetical protein
MGTFLDQTPEAPFAIRDDYFVNRRLEDRVVRDGLEMTFRGWTYSLEDYARAFEEAGLRIETMREPRPSGLSGRYRRWERVPMFLNIRTVLPESPIRVLSPGRAVSRRPGAPGRPI